MTLSAFAWNIVRTYTLTPGARLGTASTTNNYVGYRHLPRHGRAGCLGARRAWGFSVPPSQSCTSEPSAGRSPGWRARWTCTACRSGPWPLRQTGLRDGPAGRLAGPHGLGHAGRTHRAGQRGLRPAAVAPSPGAVSGSSLLSSATGISQHGQRRELHHSRRRVHGHPGAATAASFAAAGVVTGATLTITGAAKRRPPRVP